MERLDVVGLLDAFQQIERNVTIALMYSGLRISQFRLLDRIEASNEATVSQMSDHLGITRASASVMINELLKSGILVMVENPSDRRSFFVRLTELGHNKLNVARADLAVLRDKLSRRFPPSVVRTLNEFAAGLV